jgi:hypothetical protein
MALPPTPPGYNNWNDYIETEAPGLAVSEGLTLQEAKASLKLLFVSRPIRSAVGQPFFREYNEFTTWALRALVPELGRPWRLSSASIIQEDGFNLLQENDGLILLDEDE